MRIAVEFFCTLCPPCPPARKTSISKSSGVDLHVDLFRLRQHRDRRGRRVDAPARFGHRHALNSVRAALVLKLAVRAVAIDLEYYLSDAPQPRLRAADNLHAPAVALSKSRVHPVHLRREKSRLLATRARAYLHDYALLVVRVLGNQRNAKVVLDLTLPAFELLELLAGERGHLTVALLANQSPRILQLAYYSTVLPKQRHDVPERAVFLDDTLKPRVLPRDLRVRHTQLQLFRALLDCSELVQHNLVQHRRSVPLYENSQPPIDRPIQHSKHQAPNLGLLGDDLNIHNNKL